MVQSRRHQCHISTRAAQVSVSPVPPTQNSPYLSRNRKKRVSTMVMRTPPQRGMLWDGKGEC